MPDNGLGRLSLVSERHAVCLYRLKGWTQENDRGGLPQKLRGAEYFLQRSERMKAGPEEPVPMPDLAGGREQQNPLFNILREAWAALWSFKW